MVTRKSGPAALPLALSEALWRRVATGDELGSGTRPKMKKEGQPIIISANAPVAMTGTSCTAVENKSGEEPGIDGH